MIKPERGDFGSVKNLTVKTENFILKLIITSAERKVISVWKYAFLFLFVSFSMIKNDNRYCYCGDR